MKTRICKQCNICFEITRGKHKNVFCSRSCSTTWNNKRKENISEEHRLKVSLSLKEYYKKNKTKTFGEEHSQKVGSSTKTNKVVKSILDLSSKTTAKILKRLNIGCSICGWNESSCDIHHINGRKINNFNHHSNLTILCPNHHRLAHTNKLDKDSLISIDKILPEDWQNKYYG